MRRRVIAAVTLAVALPVQLTVVNGMALPGGGAPDLMLLAVIAFGLTGGPVTGTVTGFLAGLALDLAPPATQLLGEYALVFCLAGYLAGRFQGTLRRSALTAIGVAALAAVTGEVLAAGLTLALDSPEVTAAIVARVLPWTILYDVALTPLVVLVVARAALALGASLGAEPAPLAAELGGSAGPAAHGRRRWEVAGELAGRVLGRAGAGGAAGVAAAAATVAQAGGGAGAGTSVNWLAGPARSRRERKAQERSGIRLTGTQRGKSKTESGQQARPAPAAKLRPRAGVPGSAARGFRPVPLPVAREVRLNLGRGREGREGRSGAGWRPGLPRITFSGGGPHRTAPEEGRRARSPRIAFGGGTGRSGAWLAGGGQTGTGLHRAGLAAGGLPGTPARRISFGGQSRVPTAPARQSRTPRIPFATQVRAEPPRRHRGPKFNRIPATARPARRRPGKVARFSAGRRRAALARRLGNWLPGWVPGWLTGGLRRPGRRGGRSAVWRIGGRRMGGYE